MKITRRIAIPVITAAALFGSGGIAYANVAHNDPSPSPSPSVSQPITFPTENPIRVPRGLRPIFCYYKSPNGVQGSIVEYNWDHERTCPVGFTPLTIRDILRDIGFPVISPLTR